MTGVQTCALPICFPVTIATDTLVGKATIDTLTNKNVRNTLNSQAVNYTLQSSDAGKIVVASGGITVTLNNSVFTAGDVFNIINNDSSTAQIAIGSGATVFIVGTSYTNTTFPLDPRRFLQIYCQAATTFYAISG